MNFAITVLFVFAICKFAYKTAKGGREITPVRPKWYAWEGNDYMFMPPSTWMT